MRQKRDIQEFQECTGEHRHGYPQILVPHQQLPAEAQLMGPVEPRHRAAGLPQPLS